MKSLAHIVHDLVQHHAHQDRSRSGPDSNPPQYSLMGAQAHSQHAQAQNPSEQEMRKYLASLAGAYDLPVDFVHAAAKTENHFHQTEHVNRAYRDKHGRSVPETIDYGLMQINSRKIGHDSVKDAHGNKFKIGEDVKTDWKANARAGVAILAEQYELAKLEQGPVTSEQDRAQQAYSGYNGGPGNRDRYLHERRDGLPRNPHDRNFLENYRGERARR